MAAGGIRREIAGKARSRRQAQTRQPTRPGSLDRELLLLQRVLIHDEILALHQRIINAGIHARLKGHKGEILGERQRFIAVQAQKIAQGAHVDLIGVLRLDESLPGIRELYGGAQHINARLAAR